MYVKFVNKNILVLVIKKRHKEFVDSNINHKWKEQVN